MAAEPVQGGSVGTWGTELNAFLNVAHNADGTIGAGQPGATAATRFVGATASGAPVSGTFIAGDFVLDKSGAVWVCITGGTPGTWTCATKSRPQLASVASGVVSEIPAASFASSAAPISGAVFGLLLGLRAGDVVTGVLLRNGVAAAGTSPTTARVGIADSTGKILAISGNVNAAASWPLGAAPMAFAAPYTVLADGGYYACYLVNGTWGTTQPTPGLFGSVTSSLQPFSTNAPPAFQWTGQADLPAVNSSVTLTASGRAYYMAFY